MEINPQTIVISDDPVNSYYCNHIYYPYYYQQTFGEMQCLRAFCDTSVVWYGEDFYNFCFLPTVTKSINVVEGSEYVQIYLGYVPSTSETGSCFDCTEYFVTTDNLFLQPDGECTYIKFNETKPTDTAFVKIIVTDYSDEVYTFNVFVVNPVFTLFDYTYDHNLKRNNEIILDVCASPQFGYSLNLPDTTKYNVEIIMGYDFGNLVNNTTSDSGQVLNDLPHNYGCLGQIILRTNDQIQADSEIKIRVSTSDPSIEPIEMTFTNLLVVNIVPETISPGDTAQIIPKLKNPDGSLSDFPIEQTFEIGMLDGCALGMIKTATDSGLYVDAALQPFYFIADTGAVEGTVKLRVGVIEGMSSSSLLNNNFKSRKSEYQVKKSSTSDNHREAQSFIDGGVIGEYCFLGDLYSVVTGDANVVVGNGCASLGNCIARLVPEFVQVNVIPTTIFTRNLLCGKNKGDLVQTGGFAPLQWRDYTTQDISATPCWKEDKREVHFKMIITERETNLNSLVLNPPANLEICEQNINNAGLILIKSPEQLFNIIQKFPEQIEIIKKDIDSTLSRYNATIIKYKFYDEINAHELEHKKDYQNILTTLLTKYLEEKVNKYYLSCKQFKSDEYSTYKASSIFTNPYIWDYIDEAIKEQSKIFESDVQNRPRVQASLYEYIKMIFNFENHLIY
ncbi:MAG: hypothetical protein M5U17_08740 [Ignavibacterium sp.]|nr:hypothetical protein [Ignavibacterium sp.]